ncbi:hypothetical protein [Streptomyces sp. Tue6028]|uniref:hypothetical protein n=1 Tax=Streptomyces sp. Tue6028 TaxID=2036037 RepID=UPI003D73A0D9
MVIELLQEWGDTWPHWEVDRVQAAIVLSAAGDVDRVLELLEVAYVDYRDALVFSGFATEDWRERMNAALGPE